MHVGINIVYCRLWIKGEMLTGMSLRWKRKGENGIWARENPK